MPDLAPLTTLGLGGPARRLVTARTDDEVARAVLTADGPVLVLGGGSNVVVPDEGFPGTVVLVRTTGVTREGSTLTVAAGEVWDDLVDRSVVEGLAGIECLAGIPGRVGATPVQNVGAYGQDVSQTVVSVTALDRTSGTVRELVAADLGFGYRTSVLKREPGRWVVLTVRFRLLPSLVSRPVAYAELARRLEVTVGSTVPLRAAAEAVRGLRRAKGMVLDPDDPDSRSVGSFFTNPVLTTPAYDALVEQAGLAPPHWPDPAGVKVSAAWLVQHAGFAPGYGTGNVRISSKHSLALTNRGGGTTAELLALATEIVDGVRTTFGVTLVPEPVLV